MFKELEQADRYDPTPNELNHKIKDFIAKNIIPKFVPQFCKHQDSVAFNFEILVNKQLYVVSNNVPQKEDTEYHTLF